MTDLPAGRNHRQQQQHPYAIYGASRSPESASHTSLSSARLLPNGWRDVTSLPSYSTSNRHTTNALDVGTNDSLVTEIADRSEDESDSVDGPRPKSKLEARREKNRVKQRNLRRE